MKSIEIRKPGGAEELILTDTPKPIPKTGEVLIKVKAAGVNRPDILQREGRYPPPHGASEVLGLEVAGIIEETGEVVCALLEGGGYAEYATVAQSQCLPIPKGLSFEEAAALPECVFTVWNNVFVIGKHQTGETVLVHGGSSGIGTTAIQMIKAFGGQVIVTCGSNEKCRACLDLGADYAINYKQEAFSEKVLEFTQDKGVQLLLDMVGGDYLRRNIECLSEGGRHVSIAFLGGAKSEIIVPQIMKKRLTLTGSTLRPRSRKEKGKLAQEIKNKTWPKIEEGLIRPVIFKTFPLKEAADAHRALEKGDHIGKIVLTI